VLSGVQTRLPCHRRTCWRPRGASPPRGARARLRLRWNRWHQSISARWRWRACWGCKTFFIQSEAFIQNCVVVAGIAGPPLLLPAPGCCYRPPADTACPPLLLPPAIAYPPLAKTVTSPQHSPLIGGVLAELPGAYCALLWHRGACSVRIVSQSRGWIYRNHFLEPGLCVPQACVPQAQWRTGYEAAVLGGISGGEAYSTT
jgi:hypothetical protein